MTESLYGSGQYSVYVLVGDSLLSQGLKWYVGSIIATIPEPSQHEDDSYFQPKPEIKHIFRTPDSRPSKFVAFIFTILVLVPLVGLLVAVGYIHVCMCHAHVGLHMFGSCVFSFMY